MTKLAAIADVHIGNHRRCGGTVEGGLNERCRHTLSTLRRAGELVLEQDCSALLILGDLFETSDPSPRMVTAAMDVLSEVNRALPVGVIIMTGNHDVVSIASGDNALGPLRYVVSAVLDQPWHISDFGSNDAAVTFVPYQTGHAKDWLPSVLSKLDGDCADGVFDISPRAALRALVMHLGIVQPHTPGYLKASSDAVDYMKAVELAQKHGYKTVLSGHWHQHWFSGFIGDGDNEVSLVQVGALCPRGWSDEGADSYGRVIVLEDDKPPAVLEVGGPRFLRATGKRGLEKALKKFARVSKLQGALLYLDWRVSPDYVEQAQEKLQQAVEKGDVHRGEVHLDDKSVKKSVREAAAAVRTSDSLDEAVVNFVDDLDLPGEISKESVLVRAKGYLSGGAR